MSLAAAMAAASGTATPPPAKTPTPPTPPTDESFIEFLGADDVEDAAWWDFLKSKEPRADPAPTPAGTKP
jgi:hypothetical protein